MKKLFCSLIVSFLIVSHAAQASVISWDLTADVTDIAGAGTYWDDLGVAVGDTISARITFDTDVNPFTQTSPIPGSTEVTTELRRTLPGIVTFDNISISTNGGVITYDPNYVDPWGIMRVSDNEDTAFYAELAGILYDTFAPTMLDFDDLNRLQALRFADEQNSSTFEHTAFPTTIPDLSEMIITRYYLQEVGEDGLTQGLVSDVTTISVPTPLGGPLFIIGLICIALSRRGRSETLEG